MAALALLLWAVCALPARAAHAIVPGGELTLHEAVLTSLAGERVVALPHVLGRVDHAPAGGLVRYRLPVTLAALPAGPLGIFVRKLSLSGRVFLNGELVGACEQAPLERLRCLHHPYLFVPTPSLWRVGENQLEFEIYATARQDSGLSSVVVGDAAGLRAGSYGNRHILQVGMIQALTWLSALVGVLSLAIAAVLRRESVFLWFGLAAVAQALSNLNWIITRPAIDIEVYNWFVFASRLLAAPISLVAFLAVFRQTRPRLKWSLLAYGVLAAAAVWPSGTDRALVTALYLPVMVAGGVVFALMLRWSCQTREPLQVVFTALLAVAIVLGVLDWGRLAGGAAFEGIYLFAYGFSLVVLTMGFMLVGVLASAVAQSRQSREQLEARVRERTAELELAHTRLLAAEVDRTRAEERESLLQDMHDGLGSQLASARLMAEQGSMTAAQLSQILRECMSDLYLLVDTLGNRSGRHAVEAFADFRYRTQQRLAGTGLTLHWEVAIDAMPEVSQRVVLQVLRIAQEAVNNALKHAHAHNIDITARYDEAAQTFFLSIADDGVGTADDSGPGKGLGNMQQRARKIGASLAIANRAGAGVEVRLVLPLTIPAAQP